MAGSCRFAFAVHILSVVALKHNGGVNSEALAKSVNTNPVVIRRIVSALQRASLVVTAKGAHGGVKLALPPERISLSAVYRAIEPGASFSQHRQEPNQRCPVGRKIAQVLDEVFASAQFALEDALARRTLAEVLETMADESSSPPRAKKVRAIKAA